MTCSHLEMKIIFKEISTVGDAAAEVVVGLHLQEDPGGDGGYPPSYCTHKDGHRPAGTSYIWKLCQVLLRGRAPHGCHSSRVSDCISKGLV